MLIKVLENSQKGMKDKTGGSSLGGSRLKKDKMGKHIGEYEENEHQSDKEEESKFIINPYPEKMEKL